MPMMTSSSSSRPLDPAAMRDHAMMRLAFCKWKSTASVTPIASPSSPTAVKSRAASSLSVTTSQPEATTRTSTIRSSNRPGGGSADSRPLTMVELLRSLDSQGGAAPPPPLETVAASPPPASTGGQPLGASSGMGTSSSRPLVSATREDYPREGSSAGRRPSASLRSALRPLHRHQASPTLASSVRTALGGGVLGRQFTDMQPDRCVLVAQIRSVTLTAAVSRSCFNPSCSFILQRSKARTSS